jgi:SAM-dependent methyltransferase
MQLSIAVAAANRHRISNQLERRGPPDSPTVLAFSVLFLANSLAARLVACEPPCVLDDHFAGDVAARYDDMLGPMGSAEVLGPTIDLLAELARTGAALEMAVGTGRIALPLAARGVSVSGIELSPDMVAQLRAKPGGDAIPVTIGDMTTTRVEGAFRLVYLLYNTIGNVETQDRQVECFANAAAHLEPGGCFVIEVGVPDLRRLVPGNDSIVFAHAPGYVGYDRYDDLVAQHAVSHHFMDDVSGVREVRTPFRYVWPSELDLMARLSGLELVDRWADWDRSPFTGDSPSHVSVWRKQP